MMGESSDGIGSEKSVPSGRIGLGAPPHEESKPLRLRMIFILVNVRGRSRVGCRSSRHRPRELRSTRTGQAGLLKALYVFDRLASVTIGILPSAGPGRKQLWGVSIVAHVSPWAAGPCSEVRRLPQIPRTR